MMVDRKDLHDISARLEAAFNATDYTAQFDFVIGNWSPYFGMRRGCHCGRHQRNGFRPSFHRERAQNNGTWG